MACAKNCINLLAWKLLEIKCFYWIYWIFRKKIIVEWFTGQLGAAGRHPAGSVHVPYAYHNLNHPNYIIILACFLNTTLHWCFPICCLFCCLLARLLPVTSWQQVWRCVLISVTIPAGCRHQSEAEPAWPQQPPAESNHMAEDLAPHCMDTAAALAPARAQDLAWEEIYRESR